MHLLPQPRCPTPRRCPSIPSGPARSRRTPTEARGRRWRRVWQGWYVPADARRTPEQRAVAASVRLPASGAVTGWAACRLHGAAYLDGAEGGVELPVALALGRRGNVRDAPGLRLLRDHLDAGDVTVIAGVPSDFRAAGCEVVRIVAPNLRRPERVIARFTAARERAVKVTGLERGWRLDDPGPSLDERIADRQARERHYLAWLDNPVGPPPSA